MRKDDKQILVREELRDLDGILPESINRRRFFKSTLAALTGGMLAGCTGGSDGGQSNPTSGGNQQSTGDGEGQGEDGGTQLMRKDGVSWRQPWKKALEWAPPFIADLNGHWLDANVAAPTVFEGFGSDDTAKRVGTGQEEIGVAYNPPVLAGLAQGYDLSFVGTSKQRSLLGLTYRADRIEGPSDLAGKTIAIDPFLGGNVLPLYANKVGVDVAEIQTVKAGSPDLVAEKMANGEIDGTWYQVNLLLQWRKLLPDLTLKTDPLYGHVKVQGHNVFVNTSWMNDTSDGIEYVSRILEGYSHATKWWAVNPEEMLELVRNEVNPALRTVKKENQLDTQRFNVAQTLNEVTEQNGIGYISTENTQNALEELAPVILDDASGLPAAEDIVDTRPADNADLATLSTDERNKVIEFAGEAWEVYQ